MKNGFAAAVVVLLPIVAFATDYAVPTYDLGVNITVQVNGQLGYATAGGGGEFSGTVSNGTPQSLANVAFWCVDDQEAFYWGQSAPANIITLSNVSADASQVHYGTVDGGNVSSSNPQVWSYQTNGLSNAAQDRYTLAAYLVSQYPGFDQQIDGTTSDQQNEANAIQQAIWTLTNVTTNGGSFPGEYQSGTDDPNGTTGSNPTLDSVSYWISQAEANASTTVNTSGWAVVSWSAINGDLGTGNYYCTDVNGACSTNQTFLVEIDGTTPTNPNTVTPEPSFYGVLATGLFGLALAVRRKMAAK